MSSFCIYKYCKNESVVSLDFKGFHDTIEDVYPSITICLEAYSSNLFVDKNKVKKKDIYYMMTGLSFHNKTFFQNTSYEDLTIALPIEFLFYGYQGNGLKKISCDNAKCFKTHGDSSLKCFTHDIELRKQIKYKYLMLRLNKTREMLDLVKMKIFFHHPGQLFRNGMDPVLEGPYIKIANNIKLNIQSLSVIKKRENRIISCHNERFNDDKILLEKTAQMFNCTAKYPGDFK